MNMHGCIAHPCPEEREEGSGFCKQHLEDSKHYEFKLSDYRYKKKKEEDSDGGGSDD